jgi:F-box/WD-40 domain protein MET30
MTGSQQSRLMQYLQRSCSKESDTSSSLDKVLSSNNNSVDDNKINGNNNHAHSEHLQSSSIDSSDLTTSSLSASFPSSKVSSNNSQKNFITSKLIKNLQSNNVDSEIIMEDSTYNYDDDHNNHTITSTGINFTDNGIIKDPILELDSKYCYRHNPRVRCNKMADQKQLKDIQRTLVTNFSTDDQKEIVKIWSVFSTASNSKRSIILRGLISQCCFPQLSIISHEISNLLKIDFLEMLPSELALKILCYLDCQSLCNAAQVSTKWKQLADDDRVWRYMCEQHIDRKCPQCGWGLPLMAVKKLQEKSNINKNNSLINSKKRRFSETDKDSDLSIKNIPKPLWKCSNPIPNSKNIMRKKRPWKAVYSERYTVERHWRKGYYSIKNFGGHTDGVLCCQYDNNNLLMTGSYDTTVKIWNTDTGQLIRTLTGHKMGIKSLIFDDQKLITAGLDSTIKVWNWRTGECISSYTGHREGVISVDFLDKLIVSGSADKTIKVWHVDTRTCYTLRGHSDWVTCVKIHPKSRTLFSASDDSTVKLWDLDTNKCITTYGGEENGGHTAQVQCVIPFVYTDDLVTDLTNQENNSNDDNNNNNSNNHDNDNDNDNDDDNNQNNDENDENDEYQKFIKSRDFLPTHLLTASLDNTIKLWDVKTGKCIRTQFGHIEGVWSIAADTFRIISGAHDKTIKIWDLQNGQCMHTLTNASSVSCVALGDSRVVCGLENGEVKMYCFDCKE